MVEAKSRADLRRLARLLREHLRLDDVLYFPIVELLDVIIKLLNSAAFPMMPPVCNINICQRSDAV